MKRIAVLAILAIVVAMVPMTTVSSQPTGEDVGNIHFINGITGTQFDIYIEIDDGNFERFGGVNGLTSFDFLLPPGTHRWVACANVPSSGIVDPGFQCDSIPPGVPVPNVGTGTFDIDKNDELVLSLFAAGPPPFQLFVAENDLDPTDIDEARVIIHNAALGALPFISFCLDGEPLITNVTPGNSGQADFEEAEEADYGFVLGVPFVDCTTAVPLFGTLNFVGGSALAVTFVQGNPLVCGGNCVQGFSVGEERASSDHLVQAFCDLLTVEFVTVSDQLQALFAEVTVGDPDTYPSSDKVEKVITAISELIETGNEIVPAEIADAWYTLTAGFAQLSGLGAVDYDLAELPQDTLEAIVEGIDTPAADDEEEAAATAEITAWVTTNCFGAIEAEPTFTG